MLLSFYCLGFFSLTQSIPAKCNKFVMHDSWHHFASYNFPTHPTGYKWPIAIRTVGVRKYHLCGRFFFHLFIIIMGFLWKKSLCNLIGIFRNLLITRVEFLFIRSFSWYFAFYMDARNCVVCYIHSRVIIVELRCNLRIIGQINNCHLRLSCHFLHIISAILRNSIRFSEKLKENQMH